ncbi:MAG: hypothetical protein ACM3KE_08395 [Hyphomicrobiales bacterium]
MTIAVNRVERISLYSRTEFFFQDFFYFSGSRMAERSIRTRSQGCEMMVWPLSDAPASRCGSFDEASGLIDRQMLVA